MTIFFIVVGAVIVVAYTLAQIINHVYQPQPDEYKVDLLALRHVINTQQYGWNITRAHLLAFDDLNERNQKADELYQKLSDNLKNDIDKEFCLGGLSFIDEYDRTGVVPDTIEVVFTTSPEEERDPDTY